MLPDEVREAERLETLEDVRDWHMRRAAFFSHHGMPWGAMGHESKRCADIITAHLLAREAEVERLRSGLADNGCEVVYEALDAFSGETSGPWVRNIRAEQVESTARQFAEAVRREAFKMPPPNEWTPRFVMLANEVDHRITAHLSENSRG